MGVICSRQDSRISILTSGTRLPQTPPQPRLERGRCMPLVECNSHFALLKFPFELRLATRLVISTDCVLRTP